MRKIRREREGKDADGSKFVICKLTLSKMIGFEVAGTFASVKRPPEIFMESTERFVATGEGVPGRRRMTTSQLGSQAREIPATIRILNQVDFRIENRHAGDVDSARKDQRRYLDRDPPGTWRE